MSPPRARSGATALPPFDRVLDLHGPALLRFCAAQVGPDRAEDCFQETVLAALKAYGGVRDPAAVRAWLFAIAVRKTLDSHRTEARARRVAAAAAVAEPDAPLGPGAGPGRDGALWERVDALPQKQRHAIALRYVADLSHREIAAVMETSEAAARQNVAAGLARLRRELTR